MATVVGVPTLWIRGLGPAGVVGVPSSVDPGDPPLCPACNVRTTVSKVKGQTVALCQNTKDLVCGPSSRTNADNAGKQTVLSGRSVDIGGETVTADEGLALVLYVKG